MSKRPVGQLLSTSWSQCSRFPAMLGTRSPGLRGRDRRPAAAEAVTLGCCALRGSTLSRGAGSSGKSIGRIVIYPASDGRRQQRRRRQRRQRWRRKVAAKRRHRCVEAGCLYAPGLHWLTRSGQVSSELLLTPGCCWCHQRPLIGVRREPKCHCGLGTVIESWGAWAN